MANRIKFVPRFPGPIEGHAVNTSRKFFPVVAGSYDMDDLLQEAYIVFMKCKHAYGPRKYARPGTIIDNPAWFMAVYSRSLHNRFINLAAKAGKYVAVEKIEDVDWSFGNTGKRNNPNRTFSADLFNNGHVAQKYAVMIDFAEDDNYLRQVLRELPGEVKALIGKFLDGGKGSVAAYRELKLLFPAV